MFPVKVLIWNINFEFEKHILIFENKNMAFIFFNHSWEVCESEQIETDRLYYQSFSINKSLHN